MKNQDRSSTQLVQIITVPISLPFLRGQPSYMRQRGIETTIISSPGNELTTFSSEENIGAVAVPMSREISLAADIISLWRLVRCLMRLRPHIVHAQTPKAGLLGMIAAWLTRRPVRIYSILGLRYMTTSGGTRWLLKWSERLSCALANKVICVSPSVMEQAVVDKLVTCRKVTVLANGSVNGVDAESRFNPDRFSAKYRDDFRSELDLTDKDLVIGFAGRLVRDKGIEELCEAWKLLRSKFVLAKLVLLGVEESYDPFIQGALDTLRQDSRVYFAGHSSSPERWYSIMNVLVLPSHREGFPNVLLEASAMRLPVVATNIPGCIDAVENGVTGKLIAVRDTGALVEAIASYLADPVLRIQHGRAGRRRVVKTFGQEKIWAEIYEQYAGLLQKRGLHIK